MIIYDSNALILVLDKTIDHVTDMKQNVLKGEYDIDKSDLITVIRDFEICIDKIEVLRDTVLDLYDDLSRLSNGL